MLGEDLDYATQESAGVGALVGGVGVGEMVAYVAKGGGSEEGVAKGVEGYVGVAVAEEAEGVGDFYATEPQVAIFNEAMDVVAHADAYVGEVCHN